MPGLEQFAAAILGPLGALALACVVILALFRWGELLVRDHFRHDTDDRSQRDKAQERADAFAELVKDQVAATNRLSDGVTKLADDVEKHGAELAEVRRIVERLDNRK